MAQVSRLSSETSGQKYKSNFRLYGLNLNPPRMPEWLPPEIIARKAAKPEKCLTSLRYLAITAPVRSAPQRQCTYAPWRTAERMAEVWLALGTSSEVIRISSSRRPSSRQIRSSVRRSRFMDTGTSSMMTVFTPCSLRNLSSVRT